MTTLPEPPADPATALIVFTKAPVPGQAKTRLVPALGASGAAALARRMLEHAVAAARDAALGPVEICAAPDASDPVFAALAARFGVALEPQGDGDLGQRMHRALSRSLQTHARVLLIGTDAPALDAVMLRDAARALIRHDAVFVPAVDGGYALVGLRRPTPELFTGVPWSTTSVMAATRVLAQQLGIRTTELAPVHDIDEAEDLVHLPRALLDRDPW